MFGRATASFTERVELACHEGSRQMQPRVLATSAAARMTCAVARQARRSVTAFQSSNTRSREWHLVGLEAELEGV